jgi:hypothetical protein
MIVYTKTSQLLSLFLPATALISFSIEIHFKSYITVHSATRLSRDLLAFDLFNPNLVKNSSLPFRCLHTSHVSSFSWFKTNNIRRAKFVHFFSRSWKTVCLFYSFKEEYLSNTLHSTWKQPTIFTSVAFRSLLLFGAESFVFQFATQKFED